ncbi:hypothetical protein OE88DRAFT_1647857 [Heliocybe sulcata]|uniref:Uncharacterized protein n=1 Tax=Heliocybe sulcata TaxID=5364 RepID=A0A5C3N0S7_9AGAM|nr:hypothetical protein OE88DRAFT_1647857 [Heliocybe sulcata]
MSKLFHPAALEARGKEESLSRASLPLTTQNTNSFQAQLKLPMNQCSLLGLCSSFLNPMSVSGPLSIGHHVVIETAKQGDNQVRRYPTCAALGSLLGDISATVGCKGLQEIHIGGIESVITLLSKSWVMEGTDGAKIWHVSRVTERTDEKCAEAIKNSLHNKHMMQLLVYSDELTNLSNGSRITGRAKSIETLQKHPLPSCQPLPASIPPILPVSMKISKTSSLSHHASKPYARLGQHSAKPKVHIGAPAKLPSEPSFPTSAPAKSPSEPPYPPSAPANILPRTTSPLYLMLVSKAMQSARHTKKPYARPTVLNMCAVIPASVAVFEQEHTRSKELEASTAGLEQKKAGSTVPKEPEATATSDPL